jgi:6-phosphogluconolactonase
VHLIATADAGAVAVAAAAEIAATCHEAVAARGLALVAVSGGETPWRMLEQLRGLDLPWARTYVAQVDERIAPRGDPRRNLARLAQILVQDGPLPERQLLAMPVETDDLDAAAFSYQRQLERLGGTPLQLDLVQLGLGSDGHTASLVPHDPVLEVANRDVAMSGEYQGLRRMTLTYPAIDRARRRLWLVTGAAKVARLAELLDGASDDDAPSVRVSRADASVVADREALANCAAHRGQ